MYLVDCEDGQCTCQKNGVTTATLPYVFDGGSCVCDSDPLRLCGFPAPDFSYCGGDV